MNADPAGSVERDTVRCGIQPEEMADSVHAADRAKRGGRQQHIHLPTCSAIAYGRGTVTGSGLPPSPLAEDTTGEQGMQPLM